MAQRGRRNGFSLIEMLITLAIISLMIAMVAPNLAAAVDRITVRNAIADLTLQTQLARVEALRSGRPAPASDPAEPPPWLRSPDGWTLTMEQPAGVGADGVCLPARARLAAAVGRPRSVTLDAETCRWSLG